MRANESAWTTYFQYLVAASGVILAIAFLAFQERRHVWHGNRLKWIEAIVTITELSTPMFFGLIFLTPGHPWVVAGRIVGALGWSVAAAHALVFLLVLLGSLPAGQIKAFDWVQLVLTLGFSGATYGLLILWQNLDVKAYVCLWMIFSGLVEAWWFLGVEQNDEPAGGSGHEP